MGRRASRAVEVRFDEETFAAIAAEAKTRETSIAAVVRRAVELQMAGRTMGIVKDELAGVVATEMRRVLAEPTGAIATVQDGLAQVQEAVDALAASFEDEATTTGATADEDVRYIKSSVQRQRGW